MNDNALTCHGCYWADKCLCDKRCDDFTPIEQSDDIPYYESILQENQYVFFRSV